MNVGLLKLDLIARGIRAEKNLPEPLANPFGLVYLVLPNEVAVSVHLVLDGRKTPYTLKSGGKQYLLEVEGGEAIPVRMTLPLKCYEKKTSSGVLVSDILTVHSGLIAVHPKGACRFGLSGLSCRYCGQTKELEKHPRFSKEDLIEAIEIVLREKPCNFVHLSSGHVETEDGGIDWLTPWVAEIRRHINILISLDLAPPKSNHWVDQSYAIGVDAVYYDMGEFNPKEAVSPDEFKKERERYLQTVEYAARIFPKGAVFSHLVVGIEPLETTRKSIDLLIDRGVVPLLVYFPPYPESKLAQNWTLTPEAATSLYAHLFERLVETKNKPHWVEQADVLVTPLEGRFFSEKSAGYHIALKKFYQTAFGRAIRMGMIGMRRRLRVKP